MTVNDVLEHINVVVSFLTNGTLLYLILKHSTSSIGTYKYLLIVFASYDLFLTALHSIVIPRAYNFDSFFSLYSARFTDSYVACPVYVAFFTTPYALMNVNFLHRYWAVTSPKRLELFSTKLFTAILFLYVIVHFFVWLSRAYELTPDTGGILSAHYKEEFNRTITGFAYLRYWNGDEMDTHTSSVLLSGLFVMLLNLTVAFFLASSTLWHIQKATTFSPTYRSLQMKIFRALLAQTLLPVVFVYTPFSSIILLPFLRVRDRLRMDLHAMTLTSFFPAWDAIVVILLMKDYRDGLINIFLRRSKITTATTVWKTSQAPTISGATSVVNRS